MNFPELPDFLRIPQEQRAASWKGKRLTKPLASSVTRLKVEDEQTRAFRRELEAAAKAKQKAALDALHAREREQRRLKKLQAVAHG